MPTALKVALIVGSILLLINHGTAILERKMTRQRWISGLFTYLVPYGVNIHGQYIVGKARVRNLRPHIECRGFSDCLECQV